MANPINRPDLIAQLEKLNPTKRQWVYDGIRLIRCFRKNLFITHDAKKDDIHLTLLAPTMRIEILAMAKEIEDIRNALQLRLNLIQSEPNGIVRETMIQNLLLDI